jgi:integrase
MARSNISWSSPRPARNRAPAACALPAVEKAKIDFGVRVHDLRHAHASWHLAGGADLKGLMDRLGHSQIQTTQKYLHTLPDTDQKNLDAFERILRNKRE